MIQVKEIILQQLLLKVMTVDLQNILVLAVVEQVELEQLPLIQEQHLEQQM